MEVFMLLSAEHISINFGSRQLLNDVNFYLNEGDKTGIIGINGTGKSTFLKVLAGVTEADAGKISRNPNVQVSYLSQNPAMDDDATILEQVFLHFPEEFRQLNEYEAKSMLNKLGVTDHTQKVGTLSGGQRKRVALAAALIHPADILVLDEPTNHLDIASREWVEAAIEEFEGVLLFVSHDRYFIEKFAERIWLLEDGKIRDFRCGYSKFRSILEHETANRSPVISAPKEKKEKPKGGTKEQEKLVRRLEREIEKQEMLIAEFDPKIEAAASDYQELTRLLAQKEEAEMVLMDLMEQWEAAQV